MYQLFELKPTVSLNRNMRGGLAFFCQKTWGAAYKKGAACKSEYGKFNIPVFASAIYWQNLLAKISVIFVLFMVSVRLTVLARVSRPLV